jgi:hypothetical protein
MGQVFMRHIVDAEVVPTIGQQLVGEVNRFTAKLREGDALHRNFLMTTLVFSAAGGLTITACPAP